MKRPYFIFLVAMVVVILATQLSRLPSKTHKYNVTYSFLYTNGMMGFADSVIEAKSVAFAIDEGKTYLMTNNHIMHPVLLNITELR